MEQKASLLLDIVQQRLEDLSKITNPHLLRIELRALQVNLATDVLVSDNPSVYRGDNQVPGLA